MIARALGIVFISIPLLIPTYPSQSTTPIKTGSSCSKVGLTKIYKGQKFSCVKKAKKLVWSKGVAIAKAQPAPTQTKFSTPTPVTTPSPTPTPVTTPSPTPTPVTTPSPTPTPLKFNPWSTDIDSKVLSDQAQQNFLDWARDRVNNPANHLQVIQETQHVNRISILKRADDLGARLFSSYFPQGSITVIGASESWTIQELAKSGWDVKRCSDPYVQGVALCLQLGPDIGRRQGYVVTSDSTYDHRNPGSDGGALLAHEYFHLVQANILKVVGGFPTKDGDIKSANALPAWFLEGSAGFVGFSVAALSQNASYWEGRERMLSYAPPQESVNRNHISDYEIRVCCGNDTPTYPYIVGQVATEYIVASIGFQKMLDIWIDFGVTKNFEVSFERVAGISKTVFYEKFEQIRTKVGLPPVSWRLDGLTNKKISG